MPLLSLRRPWPLLFLILASCNLPWSDSTTDVPDGDRGHLRIVMITHGRSADPFWSVVRNGAERAARDMGVQFEYQAPESFDIVMMAQLIDAAVATIPDGLIVSIPDADVLWPPISAALDAGIPVISINAGHEASAQLGALTHLGQTEYEAGYGGGERMAQAGVRRALCVNHQVGNTSLDLRCQGFIDALRAGGGSAELLSIPTGDPAEVQRQIQTALEAAPAVDGLLTLGPPAAAAALGTLDALNRFDSVRLASFDLSPEVIDAIDEGRMLFAIDQQQYLQGYLSVVLMTLHLTNANTIAEDVVHTGPAFVTAVDVDRYRELARQGTR